MSVPHTTLIAPFALVAPHETWTDPAPAQAAISSYSPAGNGSVGTEAVPEALSSTGYRAEDRAGAGVSRLEAEPRQRRCAKLLKLGVVERRTGCGVGRWWRICGSDIGAADNASGVPDAREGGDGEQCGGGDSHSSAVGHGAACGTRARDHDLVWRLQPELEERLGQRLVLRDLRHC